MSEESSARIDRIKKILELDTDRELSDLCKTQHPRISTWRRTGFAGTVELLLDALMDRYDRDNKPKRGRPPNLNLSIGQRVRKARRRLKLTQKELGRILYEDEDMNINTLQLRISRMERKDVIDAETLGKVAKALGMSVGEL